MEAGIAFPVGSYERPFIRIGGRIVSLHSQVETKKEILEIQTYSGTIGQCYLLVESAEMEHSARLVLI